MEKFSSLDKVVGKIPEDKKQEVIRQFQDIFKNQSFEKIEDIECEKTQEEIKTISLVNEATNAIRERYGVEPFDVPPENVHVIKKEAWSSSSAGNAHLFAQAIFLKEKDTLLQFLETTLHEMIHFKGYHVIQKDPRDKQAYEYREGIRTTSRDKKRVLFDNINEAITERLTVEYFSKLRNNPLFRDEVNQIEDIIENIHDSKSGKKLFNKEQAKEIIYAELEGEKLVVWSHSYKKARELLDLLIDKIYSKNEKVFKNREKVFDLFARAAISGHMHQLRIVDETFGKGTLRKVGEMDKDIEKQREFIKSL